MPHSCKLHDWSARHFCGALANRSILLVGDSTMAEFASSLMSSLHGTDCKQRAIYYALSDLLLPFQGHGYRERGISWLKAVELYEPDLVVITTGAHQFENGTNFNVSHYNATLQEVFDVSRDKLPGRVIWKTISSGGCGLNVLNASPDAGINYDSEDTASVSSFFPEWNQSRSFSTLHDTEKGMLDRAKLVGLQYRHFPIMDRIARVQAARAGIPILDASPLYRRVDAHIASGIHNYIDCLHFCLNPDGPLSLLNVLLHHVLLSLPDRHSSTGSTDVTRVQ